ncbi:MAG: AmmeMemoRadiSam system protein A [Myxococcales bacterium]|nr:AmmeMemoRadiSam system protein A [Myxococcales bacterium]
MSLDPRSADPPLPAPLPAAVRRWLLASARDALTQAMGGRSSPLGEPPDDPRLDRPARVFVSWHEGSRLVGCIGTLVPESSLRDAVRYFAVQAGLHDPRTPTPHLHELPRLRCEISVLTSPEPMAEQGLDSITAALVPGRDGLVLRDGDRRAVFLPVVWHSLPTPAQFVAALCRKAQIDAPRRGPLVRGERFFAEEFAEPA